MNHSTRIAKVQCVILTAGMLVTALPARAQTTNPPAGRPDFSAFKLVVDHNIFDPARRGTSRTRRGDSAGPTKRTEFVTLVGTMNYEEKGPLAFFEGTRSEYRKVLKPSDVIAGYKVKEVGPASVTLATDTNELTLPVGMQLRREEQGPWQVSEAPSSSYDTRERSYSSRSGRSRAFSVSTSLGSETNSEPDAVAMDTNSLSMNLDPQMEVADTNAPPEAASGNGETDPVLLRLMQRRAQELNR